jgi:hypothetical protein
LISVTVKCGAFFAVRTEFLCPNSGSGAAHYLQGIAVGVEADLVASDLLEPVDAFRRAEDAARIAVPCNSTAVAVPTQLHQQQLHNVIN